MIGMNEGRAETEAETEDEDPEETSFALEVHLRDYLSNNLHLIEPGLRLFKDEEGREGIEYTVDANGRRIDILAIDKADIPVVVELKVSRGHERALGQSLYYRSKAKQLLNSPKARIVIVAREITPELRIATEGLPDVELFQYKLLFKLEKV
ncbi:MAG: hypothetical protein HW384_424 [Dehalococcoidia bacterium]|nr:hypothetical protein [Dehalococcoidia bacterium]